VKWSASGLQSNLRSGCDCALGRLVRYIAVDDPGTAERFASHLLSRAELLADFPKLGTPYRERENVRRLRCDPYFIYYRVRAEKNVIEIMEFWHAARLEPQF
jgi:plasmid stabilization system protein ParE